MTVGHIRRLWLFAATFFLLQIFGPFVKTSKSQDQQEPSIEDVRKLKQNPLSALRSLNLQNDYATVGGKTADIFSLQPVWPFSITANWLAASHDRWTVPLGGGLGKVFKIGNSKWSYAASVQGFYNVLSPNSAPNWEAIAQFQIIFSYPGQ